MRALRRWSRCLRRPNVGIALDPEFAIGPGRSRKAARPRQRRPINRASAYVADVVRHHRLPTKLFIVHQFHDT